MYMHICSILSRYIYMYVCICIYMYTHIYIYMLTCIAYVVKTERDINVYTYIYTSKYFKYDLLRERNAFRGTMRHDAHIYRVVMISRLLKIILLFCKRALSKRLYSANETYDLKEPTNRSRPGGICIRVHVHMYMYICI